MKNDNKSSQMFVWKTDCVYGLCDSLVGGVPRNRCLILIQNSEVTFDLLLSCAFKKHKYLIISEAP